MTPFFCSKSADRRTALRDLLAQVNGRFPLAGQQGHPDAVGFVKRIESVERELADCSAFLKTVKTRLASAKRSLRSKPGYAAEVSKLISALAALGKGPAFPVIPELSRSLDEEMHLLQRRQRDSFGQDLRATCHEAALDFVALPDAFGVGPFRLAIDHQAGSATLEYAKIPVATNVPLHPRAITEAAAELRESLILAPINPTKLRSELQEAMRVAAARRDGGTASRADLRTELPAAYREMALIRQNWKPTTKRTISSITYPLQRFVVEVKRLIQSEENLGAPHKLALEPAVIEHTKNPKKSVFIPRDVERGYGEGTYYQAIVLR